MFTIKDAAQTLGIHPKTIRRWEAAGKISPIRTQGNQRRFSEKDIDRLKLIKTKPTLLLSPPTPVPKPKHFWLEYLGLGLAGFILTIVIYSSLKNNQNLAQPAIKEILPQNDVEIALPQAANFLNGQITIGSDTGSLSFLDEKGNLYLKNDALVSGGVYAANLQLIPSQAPEAQIGRQYVDQNTGNLMYFDGLEWTSLNASYSAGLAPDYPLASASAYLLHLTGGGGQEILTVDDNSIYPVTISQPTQINANLYVQKLIDSDSLTAAYFLDPAATGLSLSLAGEATISATLTFSKNNEYITNSVDNYLIFSGGLGIGGKTDYGFSPEWKIKAKQAQVDDEAVIANLKITTNKIEALNNDGIFLYDNSGNGLKIADGGQIYVNNTQMNVPDYAFDEDYDLLSPTDLEAYVKTNRHLPGVASAEEISQSGLNLGKIILQILERVENNVLYILDLNRRVAQVEQKTSLLSPQTPEVTPETPDLTQVIQEKIADLAEKYREETATASAHMSPIPGMSADPIPGMESSASAYLDIDSLNANSGFFSDYLAVIGQATITDLKVNNTLTVNNIISPDSRLNFLAGVMSLGANGEVVINGNLTVSGTIIAKTISPPEAANLEIKIASAGAMVIYNDIGEALATFSGQTANFNQLALNNSGIATISAGANHALIPAPAVTAHSQIMITFNDNYSPASKYWVNKDETNQQFTVFTNYPVNNDATLNWLIIN